MKTKEWTSKYNTFNGIKVLRYVDRWKTILDGNIPPPIVISIDTCSHCNFSCPHCNAVKAMNNKMMTVDTMKKIVSVLKEWKTEAVCFSGGGEPLMNPNAHVLLSMLYDNKIKVGIVTNGSFLHKYKNYSHMFEWMGISVDAATKETFAKMKGVKEGVFLKILKNIEDLCKAHTTEAGFKFLVHPNNYTEIYDATKLAKSLGCQLIHIRPAGNTWFKNVGCNFTDEVIEASLLQIEKARQDFEDKDFRVYGMTYKFDDKWSNTKSFKKCYAMYTTGIINPEGNISLCFDRRGDDKVTLCHIDNYKEWGSKKHIDICEKMDVNKCPRCTGQHIQEVFENVIVEDKMSCSFY